VVETPWEEVAPDTVRLLSVVAPAPSAPSVLVPVTPSVPLRVALPPVSVVDVIDGSVEVPVTSSVPPTEALPDVDSEEALTLASVEVPLTLSEVAEEDPASSELSVALPPVESVDDNAIVVPVKAAPAVVPEMVREPLATTLPVSVEVPETLSDETLAAPALSAPLALSADALMAPEAETDASVVLDESVHRMRSALCEVAPCTTTGTSLA
jgi:hypothetical protein